MSQGFLIASLALVSAAGIAVADELPHLQRNGEATQLMVDGAPYLALGGELHNSSPSSPTYMAPIWDRLAQHNVRTVIGAASWELVEPQEGRYDFSAVDDQIRQARAHGMHLVLIWFGAYKNAGSNYAPSWVRRDEGRFPRAERDPNTRFRRPYDFGDAVLSVFNERLVDADSRAFAALMRHIREVDRHRTVIMMQVENEVGLLNDSRDRSALAQAVWTRDVPVELMTYLSAHRAELSPWMTDLWGRQGFRQSGTWSDVFGGDELAHEVFMAWAFARYVERVAHAGATEYGLPMYANAWLGPQANAASPGQYPSGGPVARMRDVWKAAAPSLALLAPDIYVDDFAGTLSQFHATNNPIFVPEAKFIPGNLFVALGQHNAIGFSPFGIEDGAENDPVFKAYAVLNEMTEAITSAQAGGRIRGFAITGAAAQHETLGGYDIAITALGGTLGAFGAGTGEAAMAPSPGYGLIINMTPDEFLVVGQNINVSFNAPNQRVEIDSAVEGRFENGRWVPGRTLNGDERFFLFPRNDLRVVRIKLLRR